MHSHRPYGATVARLTPDQKVGRSNRSGVIFAGFLVLFAAGAPTGPFSRPLVEDRAAQLIHDTSHWTPRHHHFFYRGDLYNLVLFTKEKNTEKPRNLV